MTKGNTDYIAGVNSYSESSGSWAKVKIHNTVSNKSHISFQFYLLFKRFFDIVLSIIALIILSPLLLITAIAIKLDSDGPAIYEQKRVGQGGKIFTFYKFRSMCVDADKQLKYLKDKNEIDGPAFKMSNDPRVTKIGRFIRKVSIDELPQLINVLRGNMAIVGPRPPLPNEFAQYTPEQMHRLDVKPGLTCYWQISGRSDISFDKWMQLDYKYIKERNLWTDFKIILKTVPVVLTGKGAY
ncbi:MAG TPA: multidrug MFS transporter [Clostridiales bacterium]|jgi:exopolysaccharide biosynthesis polyprenyl glycosylphosphotransferase|nr:multidrug MFS transporter [Clostridiales bacterium]